MFAANQFAYNAGRNRAHAVMTIRLQRWRYSMQGVHHVTALFDEVNAFSLCGLAMAWRGNSARRDGNRSQAVDAALPQPCHYTSLQRGSSGRISSRMRRQTRRCRSGATLRIGNRSLLGSMERRHSHAARILPVVIAVITALISSVAVALPLTRAFGSTP